MSISDLFSDDGGDNLMHKDFPITAIHAKLVDYLMESISESANRQIDFLRAVVPGSLMSPVLNSFHQAYLQTALYGLVAASIAYHARKQNSLERVDLQQVKEDINDILQISLTFTMEKTNIQEILRELRPN